MNKITFALIAVALFHLSLSIGKHLDFKDDVVRQEKQEEASTREALMNIIKSRQPETPLPSVPPSLEVTPFDNNAFTPTDIPKPSAIRTVPPYEAPLPPLTDVSPVPVPEAPSQVILEGVSH